MGRKSRHKRIKAIDPFYTGQRKEGLVRCDIKRSILRTEFQYTADLNLEKKNDLKFDNKPDTLEQPVPPSLVGLQKAIEQTKEKRGFQNRKREVTSNFDEKPQKRKKYGFDDNEKVLQVERRKRESADDYIRRVNFAAANFIEKTKMEIKHSEGGGGKKGMNAKDKEKMKMRKKKQQVKKTDKRLDEMEKDFFKDNVMFGEVVQRPPEFTTAPKKSSPFSNKAGKRNLLLSHLLTSNKSAKQGRKRKQMSMAEKRIFDKKREEAIEAYRQVKAKRLKVKQPGSGVS